MVASDRIELVADNVQVGGTGKKVEGPPFPVTFYVVHGDRWPDTQLWMQVGGAQVVIATTEPRLKTALRAVLEELD